MQADRTVLIISLVRQAFRIAPNRGAYEGAWKDDVMAGRGPHCHLFAPPVLEDTRPQRDGAAAV